jgi:hypothetical protein
VQVRECDVKNADLISLRQNYNNKQQDENTLKADSAKLLLDALKLVDRGILQLGPD